MNNQGNFMKKKILIILSIWVILSSAFGFYYVKHGPKPKKVQKPIKTGYKAAKEPFKSLGAEIVNIELKNTKQNKQPFIKKMYDFGAKNVVIRTEINSSKFAKSLPDVIIGGKKYKNKQVCTIVLYEYKGKNYEVGNCK